MERVTGALLVGIAWFFTIIILIFLIILSPLWIFPVLIVGKEADGCHDNDEKNCFLIGN